jgi:hypothetical protein
VESIVGQGSTFALILPAVAKPKFENEASEQTK